MVKNKSKGRKESIVDRGVIVFVSLALVLVILFFVLYYLFSGLGTVKYEGLTFSKERMGELIFYKYNYYFKDLNGGLINYNLYVRNDPSKNNVPVSNEIKLVGSKISLGIDNSGLKECNDSTIAVAGLISFLSANQFKMIVGSANAAEAKEMNRTYIDCDINKTNMIVTIQPGNSTEIIQRTPNCYRIMVSECNILKAVEKFEVQSIADAKKGAEK